MGLSGVSIIVPIYNGEKYLDETVQSVLYQTYKNWELLLIDDGSVDNSSQIARNYSYSYPDKIRYMEHPGHVNRGQFATRIFGASHARENIIALLDQDDVWEVNYLENHLKRWDEINSQNVALSYGPSLYWFFDDPSGEKDYVQPVPFNQQKVYKPGELLDSFFSTRYANTPCPSAALVRREIFKNVSKFERSAKGNHCEDQYLWWYIAARYSIAVHIEPWVRYRQHSASALAQITASTLKSVRLELNFVKDIRDDLKKVVPDHSLLKENKLDNHIKSLKKEYIKTQIQEYVPANLYSKGSSLYRMVHTITARRSG
jgi:glycosyltransferase involved in cell wall biosynthesis